MKENRFSRRTFVPAILLANSARTLVDTSTLPAKDWKVHSGVAPVANEEVHSIKSQEIAGTRNMVIDVGGKQLSATKAEVEVFATDYLKSLGYTIKSPARH